MKKERINKFEKYLFILKSFFGIKRINIEEKKVKKIPIPNLGLGANFNKIIILKIKNTNGIK
jgi:hypothetical protein